MASGLQNKKEELGAMASAPNSQHPILHVPADGVISMHITHIESLNEFWFQLDEEQYDMDWIFSLHGESQIVAPFVFKASLASISPLHKNEWPDEAIEKFRDFAFIDKIKAKRLHAHILDRKYFDGQMTVMVSLVDDSCGQYLWIEDVLVSNKLAKRNEELVEASPKCYILLVFKILLFFTNTLRQLFISSFNKTYNTRWEDTPEFGNQLLKQLHSQVYQSFLQDIKDGKTKDWDLQTFGKILANHPKMIPLGRRHIFNKLIKIRGFISHIGENQRVMTYKKYDSFRYDLIRCGESLSVEKRELFQILAEPLDPGEVTHLENEISHLKEQGEAQLSQQNRLEEENRKLEKQRNKLIQELNNVHQQLKEKNVDIEELHKMHFLVIKELKDKHAKEISMQHSTHEEELCCVISNAEQNGESGTSLLTNAEKTTRLEDPAKDTRVLAKPLDHGEVKRLKKELRHLQDEVEQCKTQLSQQKLLEEQNQKLKKQVDALIQERDCANWETSNAKQSGESETSEDPRGNIFLTNAEENRKLDDHIKDTRDIKIQIVCQTITHSSPKLTCEAKDKLLSRLQKAQKESESAYKRNRVNKRSGDGMDSGIDIASDLPVKVDGLSLEHERTHIETFQDISMTATISSGKPYHSTAPGSYGSDDEDDFTFKATSSSVNGVHGGARPKIHSAKTVPVGQTKMPSKDGSCKKKKMNTNNGEKPSPFLQNASYSLVLKELHHKDYVESNDGWTSEAD